MIMTNGIRASHSSDTMNTDFGIVNQWYYPITSSWPYQFHNPNLYHLPEYTPPPTPPHVFHSPQPPPYYTPYTHPCLHDSNEIPSYSTNHHETQTHLNPNFPVTYQSYSVQTPLSCFMSPPVTTTQFQPGFIFEQQPELIAPQMFEESPESQMSTSNAIDDNCHRMDDKYTKMLQILEKMGKSLVESSKILKGISSKPVGQSSPMLNHISNVDYLDSVGILEKTLDVETEDSNNSQLPQLDISAPHLFEEMPERVETVDMEIKPGVGDASASIIGGKIVFKGSGAGLTLEDELGVQESEVGRNSDIVGVDRIMKSGLCNVSAYSLGGNVVFKGGGVVSDGDKGFRREEGFENWNMLKEGDEDNVGKQKREMDGIEDNVSEVIPLLTVKYYELINKPRRNIGKSNTFSFDPGGDFADVSSIEVKVKDAGDLLLDTVGSGVMANESGVILEGELCLKEEGIVQPTIEVSPMGGEECKEEESNALVSSCCVGADNVVIAESIDNIDHSPEVTTDLFSNDGALLVNCIQGIGVQTETVRRQALRVRIQPVLAANKMDMCFLELHVDGEEVYQTFQRVMENANAIVTDCEDPPLGDVQVYCEIGTITFSTGLHGWAFNLLNFAKIYEAKMEIFWREKFFESATKEWSTKRNNSSTWEFGVVQCCCEPIKQISNSGLNDLKDELWPILQKINLTTKFDEKDPMEKSLMKPVLYSEVFTWGKESGGRHAHGVHKEVMQPQLSESLTACDVYVVAIDECHKCSVTLAGSTCSLRSLHTIANDETDAEQSYKFDKSGILKQSCNNISVKQNETSKGDGAVIPFQRDTNSPERVISFLTAFLHFNAEIISGAFEPSSMMAKGDPHHDIYMACCWKYVGDTLPKEVNAAEGAIKTKKNFQIVTLWPTWLKCGTNHQAPTVVPENDLANMQRAVCMEEHKFSAEYEEQPGVMVFKCEGTKIKYHNTLGMFELFKTPFISKQTALSWYWCVTILVFDPGTLMARRCSQIRLILEVKDDFKEGYLSRSSSSCIGPVP